MEKLVSIVKQFPLQERQYNDREGHPQVFASRGFVLCDGIDTFYAEATGDYARSLPTTIPQEGMHGVQVSISAREYTDREGHMRYTNEIRINKLN